MSYFSHTNLYLYYIPNEEINNLKINKYFANDNFFVFRNNSNFYVQCEVENIEFNNDNNILETCMNNNCNYEDDNNQCPNKAEIINDLLSSPEIILKLANCGSIISNDDFLLEIVESKSQKENFLILSIDFGECVLFIISYMSSYKTVYGIEITGAIKNSFFPNLSFILSITFYRNFFCSSFSGSVKMSSCSQISISFFILFADIFILLTVSSVFIILS